MSIYTSVTTSFYSGTGTTSVEMDVDESQDQDEKGDWVVEVNDELKKFTENWKRTDVSMIEFEPVSEEVYIYIFWGING